MHVANLTSPEFLFSLVLLIAAEVRGQGRRPCPAVIIIISHALIIVVTVPLSLSVLLSLLTQPVKADGPCSARDFLPVKRRVFLCCSHQMLSL